MNPKSKGEDILLRLLCFLSHSIVQGGVCVVPTIRVALCRVRPCEKRENVKHRFKHIYIVNILYHSDPWCYNIVLEKSSCFRVHLHLLNAAQLKLQEIFLNLYLRNCEKQREGQ